jgi:ankyrin repeat protein
VLSLLVERGADPDVADKDLRRTPLHLAAASGRPNAVKVLLATGRVDINRRDLHGRTPLHYAAAGVGLGTGVRPSPTPRLAPIRIETRLEVIRALVEAEADVSVEDSLFMTPLVVARLRSCPEAEAMLTARKE